MIKGLCPLNPRVGKPHDITHILKYLKEKNFKVYEQLVQLDNIVEIKK